MRVYNLKLIPLCVILLLSATCIFGQKSFSPKDSKAIINIKETYKEAWLKNDSERILSLFTEDATIYPNGLSPRTGKENLRKFWFSPSDTKTIITDYDLGVSEIHGDRKMAVASGSTKIKWTMMNKDGTSKKYASEGNYMTVFTKEKNVWRIFKHIWNGKFLEVKN